MTTKKYIAIIIVLLLLILLEGSILLSDKHNNVQLTKPSKLIKTESWNKHEVIHNKSSYLIKPVSILKDGGLSQDTSGIRNVKIDNLVEYKGPIKHMFFHPLIAYPEVAFNGNPMTKGYDDWFVTVKEFNAIIESVYRKNYILVDINWIYEKTVANGKVSMKINNLYLPRGKKPLIISIDDLNYYDYMIKDGNVFKLILDMNGNVATYSVTKAGVVNISHQNEIIPLLDTFVLEHPEFSLNRAKGCIALTGFQRILANYFKYGKIIQMVSVECVYLLLAAQGIILTREPIYARGVTFT